MNIILDNGAFKPEFAHKTDAGADLRSPVEAVVPAHGSVVIDTGVHVEIPEGYTGFLKSKSGLNVKHNLTGEGVIDASYTGSVRVKLYNHGDTDYQILRGDKIIQMVILPCAYCEFTQVDKFAETERGAGGFGSTGEVEMKENPANALKDTMWKFLMDKGQKSNIPALKEYVYDLIQMTTQKTAGQRKAKDHISWDELDMTIMSIVIEATALVLSGDLDEIKEKNDMTKGIILLEDIPRSCVECPMCYHATDMIIGKFQYERLYRCGLEPEDVEQVYLEDICHKKPDWCPVRVLPEMAHHEDYCDNGRYDKGWNDCLNEIEGKM